MTSLARNPRLWVVGGALVLVSVGGLGGIPSLALIKSTRATTTAGVTSGSIAIGLSNGASSTAWLSATGVGVGTLNAVYQQLVITNSGTGEMRYAMTSASSNATSPLIEIDIVSTASGTAARPRAATTCDAASYSGGTAVSLATATLGAGSATEVAIIGSKSTGGQTGDQVLPGGGSQTLCLRAFVVPGAGRTAQGKSSITSTFKFYAEQTANNA
ncbi:MAG: hypothetical protein NTZ03_06360 [Actinobacteria bacterium]|nr:hypothetical protein [Actinomycetota bacterium]